MNQLQSARIIYAGSNRYRIIIENKEYQAVLIGSYTDSVPAVGDMVNCTLTDDKLAVIHSPCPRTSVLQRKKPDSPSELQTLVANATHLFIIMGMDETFSERRLERFLVLAASGNIKPVVILSKADLHQPGQVAVYQFTAEESAPGVNVIPYSAVTGEGLDEIKSIITNDSIICSIGVSGAGKSTLINLLMGKETQATALVRDGDNKGRHTTTARQMIQLPNGGWIIDTPGLREVGLTGDEDAVEAAFTEIEAAAVNCFFNNCTHDHEPNCAVKKAVEDGDIKEVRYASYLKLIAESKALSLRQGPEQRKEGKRFKKMVKEAYKHKKRF